MHTVELLHQDLPEYLPCIRRSKQWSKAAVIATGFNASRSLVLTVAGDSRERDFHLAHVVQVPPKQVESLEDLGWAEFRMYHWRDMLDFVQAFLDGASEDALCDVASGRKGV